MVLIYFDQDEPLTSTASDAEVVDDDDGDDSTYLLHDPRPPALSQNRSKKRTHSLQPLLVRLRTRLCDMPRLSPVKCPEEVWTNVRHYGWLSDLPHPTETRYAIMKMAPFSPLWSRMHDKTVYDPAEWEAGTDLQRLCLLPHCDYSFDLNREISVGKYLVDEHTEIIGCVLSRPAYILLALII